MTIDGNEVVAYSTKYLENFNLCIVLMTTDTNEMYAKLTTNILDLPPDEAAVDTNNFPDAVEFIEANKLGENTGKTVPSGFCTYPIYKFYLNKIPKLPNGS